MNKGSYCPDEGDIINLDFDPQAGSEQAGRRPALVLSPRAYNQKTGLAVVCPVTSRVKGHPFEVLFPDGTQGITGVVLSDHVKSLSWSSRRAEFRCPCPQAVQDDVRAKLAALLGIDA